MGFLSDLFKADPEVDFQMALKEETMNRNYEKAAWLYQKAVDNGHIKAKYFLAQMYLDGRGVPANYNNGYKLLSESAAAGFDKALALLNEVRAAKMGYTFTDPQSTLNWARNGNVAGKKMDWSEATTWVKSLNYGGHRDWRLPTKDEFEAFITRGGKKPYEWFNANGFYNVQPDWYWSSSICEYNSNYRSPVILFDGEVYGGDSDMNSEKYVWIMRSGQ